MTFAADSIAFKGKWNGREEVLLLVASTAADSMALAKTAQDLATCSVMVLLVRRLEYSSDDDGLIIRLPNLKPRPKRRI